MSRIGKSIGKESRLFLGLGQGWMGCKGKLMLMCTVFSIGSNMTKISKVVCNDCKTLWMCYKTLNYTF